MYEIIIRDYINKLTEQDILDYAKQKDMELTDEEVKILYLYAKNYWRDFYKGDPTPLIEELKEKLRPKTFTTLYEMYYNLKSKLKERLM